MEEKVRILPLLPREIRDRLEGMENSLARYGYTLEIGNVHTNFVRTEVATNSFTLHLFVPAGPAIDDGGYPVYAVRDSVKSLCGILWQSKKRRGYFLYEEYSWILPPNKRIIYLSEVWTQSVHQAMAQIDTVSIVDAECQAMQWELSEAQTVEEKLDVLKVSCKNIMSRIYRCFMENIAAVPSDELVNSHFTYWGDKQSIIEENAILINGLVKELILTMLRKAVPLNNNVLDSALLQALDFSTIKQVFRNLGKAANGSIGVASELNWLAFINVKCEGTDTGAAYHFSLSDTWAKYVNELKEEKEGMYRDFGEVYQHLKDYQDSVIIATSKTGFNFGKGGTCPVVIGIEGIPHTYDILIDAAELLVKRACQYV
jgi:hypothetical protein